MRKLSTCDVQDDRRRDSMATQGIELFGLKSKNYFLKSTYFEAIRILICPWHCSRSPVVLLPKNVQATVEYFILFNDTVQISRIFRFWFGLFI